MLNLRRIFEGAQANANSRSVVEPKRNFNVGQVIKWGKIRQSDGGEVILTNCCMKIRKE